MPSYHAIEVPFCPACGCAMTYVLLLSRCVADDVRVFQ
jgi:hypothetical protein